MLIQGNAMNIPLADKSVQCCVTSPPYWGLRDYGNSDQLGLESTPEEYVQNMVQVFGEVKRVLKDDGTLWLNLGDSYASNQKGSGGGWVNDDKNYASKALAYGAKKFNYGLKDKDLVGIPWQVAFALRADGWYLRQDIIWAKPNPMPESVTDRCTKAHEYIFLLAKSQKYFYSQESVLEPALTPDKIAKKWISGTGRPRYDDNNKGTAPSGGVSLIRDGYRNRRSVWAVTTQPVKESHFATFPEKLITPCILAGSKEGDVVFDPFIGSGTTVRVAEKHNRKGVGLDLSYQDIAVKRTTNIQKVLVGF